MVRRLLLAGLLIVAGWAALAAWSVLRAYVEIEDGRDQVRAVQILQLDQVLDGTAEEGLASAHDRFEVATGRLENPLLAPVRLLPWAGRQFDSVTALSRSSRDATASAQHALASIGQALGEGIPAGPERVAALRLVAEAAGDLRADLNGLDPGPADHLIGKLAEARTEFERERDVLEARMGRIETTTAGLADFLDGPHRYLVLAANNAQMQNGQGMFLDYAVLETAGGGFTLSDFQTLPDLPSPSTPVALDPDIAAAWPWMDPNHDWRHLGTTARFPVTAATAQQLWAAIGQIPVDGVLAVDVPALGAMLHLTGPVTVDGALVEASTVYEYLLHGQYREFLGNGETDETLAAREDRLRDVASASLAAVESVGRLDLASVSTLADVVRGRHLLMWSSEPSQQAAFEAAGIDGSVPADGLLVSLVNRGGNKLDWFMEVGADIAVESSAAVDRVTVQVHLHNEVDPAVEPRYVVGPYPGSGLQAGQYLGVVAFTLPVDATGVTVEGGEVVVAGRDGPGELIGLSTLVDPGGDATVVLRFDLPAADDSIRLEPSGRARGIEWQFGDSLVLGVDGRTVSW